MPHKPGNKHYIAMSGIPGCIPETTSFSWNRKGAIDYLIFLHESHNDWKGLTQRQQQELRRDGILYFDTYVLEIAECTCPQPWVHEEEGVDPARWCKENDFWRFELIDAINGYYLTDHVTNKEVCLGDGVDMLFEKDGKPIKVGTKRFFNMLERVLNESPEETLEAYFN